MLDSSETNTSGGRKLFWLPVIMLLWVNVHGGFLMGFFLLGIYALPNLLQLVRSRNPAQQEAARKRFKRLLLVTILSAVASLANPYGYKLHTHVFQYLSNRFLMNHIDEFQSPNFHGIAQQCFLLLCLVSIAILAAKRGKPRSVELLVVLFAIATGMYASRNLPTSAILLTLVVAPFLSNRTAERSDAEPQPETRSYLQSLAIRMETLEGRLRGHLLPVLTVLVVAWVCLHAGRLGANQLMAASFSEKRFPVGAVDILQQSHIEGPIFAPDDWGGYLIYRLYPVARVVADDRHDLYGEQFFKNYLKLVRVESGWEKVLQDNHAIWVLVPVNSALGGTIAERTNWIVVYRDDVAILLEKKSGF